MTLLLLILCVVVLLFGFVLLFGAPYLPTMKKQADEALELLDLKPGQMMLELGCGDGRMLRAAAKRGIYGVGYELNPLLVVIAKIVTWRYRKLVKIHFGDFWRVQWPEFDGVYVFLLQKYMQKLDTKIIQESDSKRTVRLVSYAFTIPKKDALKQSGALTLYEYGMRNKG